MDCIKHIIRHKYGEKITRIILENICDGGIAYGYNYPDTCVHSHRTVGIHDCRIEDIASFIDEERVKLIINAKTIISIYRSFYSHTDCEIVEWFKIEASVDFDLNDFQLLYVGLCEDVANCQDNED